MGRHWNTVVVRAASVPTTVVIPPTIEIKINRTKMGKVWIPPDM